ncbi:hypothetical protein HOK68_04895 [Candidatus Woesearchaeota archaeon]|nr:hypothetical protein [Candidatus Woesearchaeota archaeon]MBT4595495.1 hypothetical protein [Candidatus Woesearchaeota archaeon]MBT5740681.1 hypothetical protein [Candidatus Woesearchaeota archaeon]MBT6506085.1 hypothetical protein [Candidatus Woesearchaeota archaeon]MBT7849576.1 hypothetical protein [Candidatus Woesearchaeota archaeon]
MAEDISNRTLAALLAVTIVVSLGGTFFVLNNPAQLSGLLVTENNQSGTVNVTLSSLISLQIVKSGIIMTNLTAGVTTVSTSGIDGGSAAANAANQIVLINNGTGNIALGAYHSSNNDLQSPWTLTSSSCSIYETAAAGDCRYINESAIWEYGLYVSGSNCTAVNGQTYPIWNSSAVALNTSRMIGDDCGYLSTTKGINVVANMTVPVGQAAVSNRILNVTFIASAS